MKAFFLLLLFLPHLVAEPRIHEGEVEGAKYLILSPEKPNGKVLLLAHGYRPKEAPLSAQFQTDGLLASTLSEEGWVIASTSYRRNGWIIDDALADLRALQAKVAELHSPPTRTLILGNSMGGQIVALAAEGKLSIDGAIGIGSAFQNYPKKDFSPQLSFAPKAPFILLINQEANRPMSESYFQNAGSGLTALWKIERPGHCNTSDREKLAAIRGLEDWLEGKEVPREKDATSAIPQLPSSARISLTGTVTHLNESWGNLTTSFVASDLETLGAKLNDSLVVSAGGKSHTVTLTSHYSLLPQGRGAAYLEPDGHLILQINGQNLAQQLGITQPGKITLSLGEAAAPK
ncbi:SAM hydroxide adenosyltransferase [Roseibacillus persicicus]|uniref:alpha/beta hydrolase n=1 Tax=Roseibacillus persicicus TaxID=454148 RepID=UPI00398B29FC